MEKEKWYRNPEMLVAMTALFIGLITAVISVYSAYIDRTYAKASIWPKLEIFRSFGSDSFQYGVSNKGIGPAIIRSVKVNQGSKYIKRWSEIPEFTGIIQYHISRTTLLSGETISPLSYQGDLVTDILALDDELGIELCYCSVYDDCWIVDRSNETIEVRNCLIDENQSFLQ